MTTASHHLRSKPTTVQVHKERNAFGIDKYGRPLTYTRNSFRAIGGQEEIIFDYITGLMWQKAGSEKRLTYKAAQAYIAQLNRQRLGGYAHWRLPTIPELMSLLEPEKQSNDLYIRPKFDKTQRWCWSADTTSSSDKGSPESAWLVDFRSGNVHWCNVKTVRYVRATCSWQ